MEVSKKNSLGIKQLLFSCSICCSPRKRKKPPAVIPGLSPSSTPAACGEEEEGGEADKGDTGHDVASITAAWLASRQAGIMGSSRISQRLRKAGPSKAERQPGAITSGLYQRTWHPQMDKRGKSHQYVTRERDYRRRTESAYATCPSSPRFTGLWIHRLLIHRHAVLLQCALTQELCGYTVTPLTHCSASTQSCSHINISC